MHLDEHEDWIDGFESWEEVWALLPEDWLRIEDLEQRLTLHRDLDRDLDLLMVIETDHRLRAQQRRSLHRLGFRAVPAGRRTVWRWDVAEAVRKADLATFAHPAEAMFNSWDPAARPAKIQQLRTRLARAQLLTQQTQQVVRDVFRSSPGDLAVVIYQEPDWWGEDYDEDDDDLSQLPTG